MNKRISAVALAGTLALVLSTSTIAQIGREVAIAEHLNDGQEFEIPRKDLIAFGKSLFTAVWTSEEGGGRPLTKGTGNHVPGEIALVRLSAFGIHNGISRATTNCPWHAPGHSAMRIERQSVAKPLSDAVSCQPFVGR